MGAKTCPECAEAVTFTQSPHGNRCPSCGYVERVAKDGVEPEFQRDKFLLRQKALAIGEKYFVWDEEGRTILFVERPAHMMMGCVALLAAAAVFFVVMFAAVALAGLFPKNSGAGPAVGLLGLVGASVLSAIVAIAISPKRHVTFHRGETPGEPLLRVLQDQKWAPFVATFTVLDMDGKVLARLQKNYIYNLFRKRWYVRAPDSDEVIALALEDSLVLALTRRLLGSFFGILRTNFLIVADENETPLGKFDRKFTLLDRYVLDMSADRRGELDRRVALALGVMLDTGEKR